MLFLTGCNESETTHSELARTRAEVAELKTQLQKLSDEYHFDKLTHIDPKDDFSPLSFDQPGYQPVETPVGHLLIAEAKAEPYLDGFKISMSIGNPMSANLQGIDIACMRIEGTNFSCVTNSLTDQLVSGKWNKISFVYAPATLKQLRLLSVNLKPNVLMLSQPQ